MKFIDSLIKPLEDAVKIGAFVYVIVKTLKYFTDEVKALKKTDEVKPIQDE